MSDAPQLPPPSLGNPLLASISHASYNRPQPHQEEPVFDTAAMTSSSEGSPASHRMSLSKSEEANIAEPLEVSDQTADGRPPEEPVVDGQKAEALAGEDQGLPTVNPDSHVALAKPKGWSREETGLWLTQQVDIDDARWTLAAFCFMTGYIDAIAFTACYIWCAFMTGNTVQLSLALGRLINGPEEGPTFLINDRQALTSLASFLGGVFIGRIGDNIPGGPKSRGWHALGTFIQAMLTVAAALCAIWSGQSGLASDRGDPSWTSAVGFLALAFMSASMGLQSQQGTRLGAHFATTVVITSVWAQLISDPVLFKFNKIYPQRDYKTFAIFACFLGGFVGRVLTGSIGPAKALGIGAALRVVIAATWFFIPEKRKKA